MKQLTSKEVVEMLQNEAKNNPVFNAVAHVFAQRQRTRFTITTANLNIKMQVEGFKYQAIEYVKCLEFLSRLGIGELKYSNKGKLLALDNIKITLQSIGKAALEGTSIKTQTPHRKFSNLDVVGLTENMHKKDFVDKRSKVRETSPYPAFLTVIVEGRPMLIQGPQLQAENLGEFLVKFKALKEHGV